MEVNPKFSDRAREDYVLIRLALDQNDQAAYARLLARYRDSIFFLVLKMVHDKNEAEDLTIEAFGKAFVSLHSYQPEYAFSTWLYKIAANNTIDFIRKKRLQATSLDKPFEDEDGEEVTMEVRSGGFDPEEIFIREQRALLLREMLKALDARHRVLVEMRYFEELSYEEIATKMKMPIGTVKTQVFRAKELLYAMMAPNAHKY